VSARERRGVDATGAQILQRGQQPALDGGEITIGARAPASTGCSSRARKRSA
jgi:hypothetical protein